MVRQKTANLKTAVLTSVNGLSVDSNWANFAMVHVISWKWLPSSTARCVVSSAFVKILFVDLCIQFYLITLISDINRLKSTQMITDYGSWGK